MRRHGDDAKIIDMVNRCEEIILQAKKAAREIEEKVRKELEALGRGNPHRTPSALPVATGPSNDR